MIKINFSVPNIAILILGFQLTDLLIVLYMYFGIMSSFSFRIAKVSKAYKLHLNKFIIPGN